MGCKGTKAPSPVTNGVNGSESTSSADTGGGNARLLDKYVVGAMLGQGTFGIVYACRPRGGDQDIDCAVKMVDKVETPVDKITEEANYLKKMNHKNVIKCLDVIYEKCFVCIVMERLRGGDLITAMQSHWKTKGTIPLQATILIVTQMSSSLAYLHSLMLVHRDVKGDNYLCDRPEVESPNVRVVLTDFGTVCECPPGTRLHEKCGTKLFWSPEFYSRDYAIPVDIFAMGIVYYGLINGRFPFRDETEVRNKVVKLNDSTPPDCKNLLFATLEKDEFKRIVADNILQHPFLKNGAAMSDATPNAVDNSTNAAAMVRETAANGAVLERRQELVERLQDVYIKFSQSNSQGMGLRTSSIQDTHYWKPKFTIKGPRDQGMFVYEWWDAERVAKELDVSIIAGAKQVKGGAIRSSIALDLLEGSGGTGSDSVDSVEQVSTMLKDHGIDVSKFGQDKAKTIEQLSDEIQNGAAIMMLDASRHKSVVRVVNIVMLRIRTPKGQVKYLVETGEEYSDGRTRSLHRLPAAKKHPHENSRQCAERIVKESIAQMGKMKIKFDWSVKELFEDEEESPSFPGVRTVYRKEIIEGTVTDASRGSGKGDQLKKNSTKSSADSERTSDILGMQLTKTGAELERTKDDASKKFFKWITEKECIKLGVKFKAPQEGMQISGLVHAPIGLDEESLRKKLIDNKVDIKKFGVGQAKSISDLSSELVRGECILAADTSKKLQRIVDIVVIKLCHPDGRILVEVEHIHGNGNKTQLKRLPGAKRRPDENQFLTVRRMLKRTIRMEEDHVVMDNRNVEVVEEEKASVAYPMLPTCYRKRIIPANLMAKINEVAV